MNETIDNIPIGTYFLSVLAVLGLLATAFRYSVSYDRLEGERFVVLFLAGKAHTNGGLFDTLSDGRYEGHKRK